MNWLYVFIGGGIGCVLRYGLGAWITRMQYFAFPWSTLLANIVSCLVFAGSVFFLGEKVAFSSTSLVRPLLLTGFCGGLSTFSTFSFETFELVKRGEFTMAFVNILVNTLLCFVIFLLFARK
jgi:fluoride exporter